MIRQSGEENQLIICPYDKSHNIRLARMQVHLIKCRRNHPSTDMSQCPFNSIHIVPKAELDFHVKVCSFRKSFEAFRMKEELVNETFAKDQNESAASFELPKSNAEANDFGNTWDDEPVSSTYNPAVYARNAQILRQPVGLTPSQRREFREEERKRLLGVTPKVE